MSDRKKFRELRAVREDEESAPRARSPFLLWAGVAALLLLTVYTGLQQSRLRDELARLHEQAAAISTARAALDQEKSLLHRTATIVADPASIQIPMPQQVKDSPAMHAYWHAKLGIVVAGIGIPLPRGDRTLELWVLPKTPGKAPLPAGHLRPLPDGTFVLVVSNPPASIPDAKALAISEEPAGGSAQPTTTPRWVGAIS